METSVTHFSPLERAILDDWLVCTSFSLANSIYFIDLCIDPDCAASAWLRRFLMTHELFGDRSLISEKWRSRQVHSNAPTVKPLRHVFPVVLPRHGVGMLVPLFVNPAPSWSASDAFASFRFESPDQTHLGPVSPLALQGLEGLLRHVEKSWEGLGGGPLPLRWRTGYAISIGCPVHFEAIDGDSLQVPLLIALLREICTTRFDVASPPRTPFGEGPVFSTGTLAQDGKFGHIDGLLKKLDAFVREFGGGSPALLTKEQQVQLNRTDRGRELLRGVRVVTIESISDLLTHPEIQPGIERLTGPPHPTEIDSLLAQIRKLNRSVWFRDAASIANWILPHVNEAPYRWEVLMHSGLNLLHRGEYVQAEVYLGELEQLILDRPALLGVDERATAAEAVGSLLFDKAEPERGLALLDAVKADLALCSVATRARALGGYCQLLRFAGRYDEAIIAGEEAVRLAQIGFASEAGRDLNYLIHALLRRAANVPHSMKCDLDRAELLLHESQTVWAPTDDLNMRAAHLGFCQHYEAVLARLRGEAYIPAAQPPWAGDWGHPRLFVLISAARNAANSELVRKCCIEELCGMAHALSRYPLFRLFESIYAVYASHFLGGDIEPDICKLTHWCETAAQAGAAGWQQLFSPIIGLRHESPQDVWVERLCDRLPYH